MNSGIYKIVNLQTDKYYVGSTKDFKRRKHTEETLNKQKEVKLGDKNPMYGRSGKLSPRSKEILDLINNKSYYSIKNASEELNISRTEVVKRLNLENNHINKLHLKC